MIMKLAEELALGTGVPGKNNIRPEDVGTEPTLKTDMKDWFPETSTRRAADTKQGELGRAFTHFPESVRDFRSTIGTLLSAKIEEISGSSAASQATARNRAATG